MLNIQIYIMPCNPANSTEIINSVHNVTGTATVSSSGTSNCDWRFASYSLCGTHNRKCTGWPSSGTSSNVSKGHRSTTTTTTSRAGIFCRTSGYGNTTLGWSLRKPWPWQVSKHSVWSLPSPTDFFTQVDHHMTPFFILLSPPISTLAVFSLGSFCWTLQ